MAETELRMDSLKPVGIATAVAVGLTSIAGTVVARCGVRVVPRTMFGPAFIFNTKGDNGERVRALQVGGAFQSATYTDERRFEPCFEYYRAFDHLFEAALPVHDILMIGGGGFAYPKHVMSTRSDVNMTVVEVDPSIVRIAKRWFYVDELIRVYDLKRSKRLKIKVADGRAFLEDTPAGSYDAVINDAFEGVAPTVGLLSAASLQQAKRSLRPGGVYLLNAVAFKEELNILNTFMELLGEVFTYVSVIPCIDQEFSGAGNYLLVASDEQHPFTGVSMSRVFEHAR